MNLPDDSEIISFFRGLNEVASNAMKVAKEAVAEGFIRGFKNGYVAGHAAGQMEAKAIVRRYVRTVWESGGITYKGWSELEKLGGDER